MPNIYSLQRLLILALSFACLSTSAFGQKVGLTIQNDTKEKIDIFWVNGTEVTKYKTLEPDASMYVDTWVGHVWRAARESGYTEKAWQYTMPGETSTWSVPRSVKGVFVPGAHSPLHRTESLFRNPKFIASIKARTSRQLFDNYIGENPTDQKILDWIFTNYRRDSNTNNAGASFENWFKTRIQYADNDAVLTGSDIITDIQTKGLRAGLSADEWKVWELRVKRQVSELVDLRRSVMNLLNRVQHVAHERSVSADKFLDEFGEALGSTFSGSVVLPPQDDRYALVDAVTGMGSNLPGVGDYIGYVSDIMTLVRVIQEEANPEPPVVLKVSSQAQTLAAHVADAKKYYRETYENAERKFSDFRSIVVLDRGMMHELAEIEAKFDRLGEGDKTVPAQLANVSKSTTQREIVSLLLPSVAYLEGRYIGQGKVDSHALFDRTDSVMAYSQVTLYEWFELPATNIVQPSASNPSQMWKIMIGDPGEKDSHSIAIGDATPTLTQRLKPLFSPKELVMMIGSRGKVSAKVEVTHDASGLHKWVAKPGIVGPPTNLERNRHWVGEQYKHFYKGARLPTGERSLYILSDVPFFKNLKSERNPWPSSIPRIGDTYYLELVQREQVKSNSWRAVVPNPADEKQWFFSTWK